MTAIESGLAALLAAHTANALFLLGAIQRYNAELTMAMTIASHSDDTLGELLTLARRLADEPNSPTAPAWEAFIVRALEERAALEVAGATLAVEAEHFLGTGNG